MPGGGEGTILPRLCSQPGKRRPGPGAAHARSPPLARAPPSRWPGLARHGVEGRRPGDPTRGRGWKVWQGAVGGRHRDWPGWGLRVRAPGMGSAPRRAGTDSGSERASPSASVPAHRPRRTMGSPTRKDYGGMGSWASLRCAGSPSTPAGHRPAGGRAQRWPLEPRELSSCRQGRTRCSCHVLALARVAGPSPHGTTDPQRERRAARFPEPASSGGKVSGVWVCPPEMAQLVGQGMNRNNGSRVYRTLQFSNRFTVYEVFYTLCGLQRAAQLTRYFRFTKCFPTHSVLGFPKISFPQKPGEYDSCSLSIDGATQAKKSVGDKTRAQG